MACAHQILCARIDWVTSFVAYTHWPKDNYIGHGQHALDVACDSIGKRCCLMSGGIAQGMHASNIVCAHRLGYIGHFLQASSIVCAFGEWCLPIVSAIAKAFKHHPWGMRIGKETSVIACEHRSTLHDIDLDLHTLNMKCEHQLADISHGICPSTWQHWSRPTCMIHARLDNDGQHHQMPARIWRVLRIGRLLHLTAGTISKACMHLMWHVLLVNFWR